MSNQLVKQLLLTGNFWVLNKDIVKLFGLETAFLLSNFAEAEQMMADKEGWFYQTSDTVETMTTLSRHKQDQCIKQLEDIGVLVKKVKGMPAKRYFKFNNECLTNLIANNLQTSMRKTNKLDCKKSATSKESINKESIKETTTTDDEFSIISSYYQDNIALLVPAVGRKLKMLTDDFPSKWIMDAMDIAVTNNKRNIAYIIAILNRWETEGKDAPKKETILSDDEKFGGIPLWE